jgi:hypothetical protein
MKVYISGISYETDGKEIDRLKHSLVSLGFNLVIPEETLKTQSTWTDKLRSRLVLLQDCPIIYMLPDWKESIMARIELTAAMNDKKHLCFNPEDVKYLITTLDG